MNTALAQRLNDKIRSINLQIALFATFIWPFWILFDVVNEVQPFLYFVAIRLIGMSLSLLAYIFCKKNWISSALCQAIIILTPMIGVNYMFAIVPLKAVPIYYLGASLVPLIAYFTLVINWKQILLYSALIFGSFLICILWFAETSFQFHTQNGLFVYFTVFVISSIYTVFRYRNFKKSVEQEILIEESNLLLTEQKNELNQINLQLKDSLNEREILIREIHHRVKNNLQIIMSLLRLQESKITSESAEDALKQSQNRIFALINVHNTLYQSEDLGNIDVQTYLEGLIDQIKDLYADEKRNILIKLSCQPILMNTLEMVPVGLIINEAITNSFKHAFLNKNEGWIHIKVLQSESIRKIIIEDNGRGIEDLNKLNENKSLGVRLIKGLARQLKGKAVIASDANGTRVSIHF